MLTITPAASDTIEQLLDDPEVPAGSGLRIEPAAEAPDTGHRHVADGAGLRMVIARAAAGGDDVLEQDGARVFLEPAVSEWLDDKVLDVASSGAGSAFTLNETH